MTLKNAKKYLDEIEYNPEKGTRNLDTQTRGEVKVALSTLLAGGQVYTMPKKAKPAQEA